MSGLRIGPEQALLAEPAQDVIGELCAGENQGVGGKLARGQPLDVQIRLQLAVKLLAGGMVGVQRDDLVEVAPQAGPPPFDRDAVLANDLPMPGARRSRDSSRWSGPTWDLPRISGVRACARTIASKPDNDRAPK
jgi:hypothetical protein